ncbi:MAG: hypothetical protein K6F84_04380 [Lachnospiraceae bacterium]|nr:hypothetical protein [Lachnospiraceae bacterium]
MPIDEFDYLFDFLDGDLENPKTSEQIQEDVENRFKIVSENEKNFPKGSIQIVCDPGIKDAFNFDFDWFGTIQEATSEYGIRVVLNPESVDFYIPGDDVCNIKASSEDRVWMVNQLLSLIYDRHELDSELDHVEFHPIFNGCEFGYERFVHNDNDQYMAFAKKISKMAPKDICVFINGSLTLMDVMVIKEALGDFDINTDFRILWRCTEEYGDGVGIVSVFTRM